MWQLLLLPLELDFVFFFFQIYVIQDIRYEDPSISIQAQQTGMWELADNGRKKWKEEERKEKEKLMTQFSIL